MGEVWLASAEGPGGFTKPVVLKTVRADLAARAELVDMLIREATLAARLSHPNLVTVFDLDCVDGTYFFAMEYVPGHTLTAVVRQARARRAALPAWFVAAVVAACCDGLQYAHDLAGEDGTPLGLVHRDVSLANVMIADTGNVTILDFGLATAAVAGVGVLQDRDFLMGKFQYLAPEIVRGEPGDRRTDVYALGVVLLIGLTGAMPYQAQDDADLLRLIDRGPPPDLARKLAVVPRRLAPIIARAMAHDQAMRTPEVAQLGAALREALHEAGRHPTADDLARHVAALFAPEAPPAPAPAIESGPVLESAGPTNRTAGYPSACRR